MTFWNLERKHSIHTLKGWWLMLSYGSLLWGSLLLFLLLSVVAGEVTTKGGFNLIQYFVTHRGACRAFANKKSIVVARISPSITNYFLIVFCLLLLPLDFLGLTKNYVLIFSYGFMYVVFYLFYFSQLLVFGEEEVFVSALFPFTSGLSIGYDQITSCIVNNKNLNHLIIVPYSNVSIYTKDTMKTVYGVSNLPKIIEEVRSKITFI